MSANILEVDIGNTRIKWRLLSENTVSHRGAFSHDGLLDYVVGGETSGEKKSITSDEGCAALFGAGLVVGRVRLANVAGDKVGDAFVSAVKIAWSLPVDVAKVLDRCGGVTHGYTDKSRLGVDRWLAIVSGFNSVKQACLVVNCGTAITVDLVNGKGQHLGGYIVPGFELMRKALFANTHAVKVDKLQVPSRIEPGRITEAAVDNGLVLMAVGLISESCRQLEKIDKHFSVIVSGGDGERLLPLLTVKASYNSHLVMDGLAYALP